MLFSVVSCLSGSPLVVLCWYVCLVRVGFNRCCAPPFAVVCWWLCWRLVSIDGRCIVVRVGCSVLVVCFTSCFTNAGRLSARSISFAVMIPVLRPIIRYRSLQHARAKLVPPSLHPPAARLSAAPKAKDSVRTNYAKLRTFRVSEATSLLGWGLDSFSLTKGAHGGLTKKCCRGDGVRVG